jgi:signal transduction histidine kinase
VKQVSLRAVNRPSPPIADTRLSGTRLIIARAVWIGLMLLFCGFYLAAALVYYVQLHGFQEGVYAHLLSTPAAINGYDALGSFSQFFTGPYATLNIALVTLISPLWIAVSLVIFWRRSDDWMALFIALFLVMLVTGGSPALSVLSSVVGFTSPLGICITLLQLLCVCSIAFFFALFPDGRFVPGWTRWLTLAYLLVQGFLCLPSTSPYSLLRWPPVLLASLFLGLALAFGFAQLYRYRRVSTTIQRQQTKWIVFGMLVAMLLDVSNLLLPLALPTSAHTVFIVLSEVTLPLALLIIPGTIGFAVLRYRLWDIDLLINRTLVYGLLTLSVLGLYILVVVGLGTVFSALGNLFLSLLATGLVAVLFQPLHQRLQRAINHLMFGERNEPYRVLSLLGQRLEETLPAESFLPTIVETVAHALKLPYVAILWKPEPGLLGAESPRLAAALGTSNLSGAETRVPLVHQGEQVGELVLVPRQRGEELTPADLRLVRDLAPQIGIAVHAARLTSDLQRLTADLQRSRERLVAAREEERRRLRRDLHDGLGPQLSSQALMLSAIKKQLRQDPDTAEQLVNDAIAHAQEAITDIRRLVYALRPPALDDLGLLAALQEQINQYHASGIVLTLEAPERLPLLPAAIEIACYRIVQEALTNVVRHAHATAATIELRVQEDLVVEVRDNGQGLPPVVYSGVGLRSMRERAEELGGTCLIETRASRGTRVRARLPLLLGQHEEHETVQQGEEVP